MACNIIGMYVCASVLVCHTHTFKEWDKKKTKSLKEVVKKGFHGNGFDRLCFIFVFFFCWIWFVSEAGSGRDFNFDSIVLGPMTEFASYDSCLLYQFKHDVCCCYRYSFPFDVCKLNIMCCRLYFLFVCFIQTIQIAKKERKKKSMSFIQAEFQHHKHPLFSIFHSLRTQFKLFIRPSKEVLKC